MLNLDSVMKKNMITSFEYELFYEPYKKHKYIHVRCKLKT